MTDRLNEKNFYAINPGFDKCQKLDTVQSVPFDVRAGVIPRSDCGCRK